MIKQARQNLENDGNLVPVAILLTDNTSIIVGMAIDMSNEEEKQQIGEALRMAAKKFGARAVLFLSEGWLGEPIKRGPGEEEAIRQAPRPSEQEGRVEVVIFSISTKGGSWIGMTKMIREEGKPPTFADPAWRSGGEGNFADLLNSQDFN
jgi:hypothetical protein